MNLSHKYEMLSRKALAFGLNLGGAFLNAAISIWLHSRGRSYYIFNAMASGFSLTLAIIVGLGYIALKDEIHTIELNNRIHNR